MFNVDMKKGFSMEKGSLAGHLLVSMPQTADPRFFRSVVYLCAHSAEGAMGIVINKQLNSLSFASLLSQLGINMPISSNSIRIHFGGPVEPGRGFVLHSNDYKHDTTISVGEDLFLTATVDVLRAMASGTGPKHSLLALGYSGWGPGQLEAEILANGWLDAPADPNLIFETDLDKKWDQAMAMIGIDNGMMIGQSGHA